MRRAITGACIVALAMVGAPVALAEQKLPYPTPPKTCHELYVLTLLSGSPEPSRYQPDGIVLADGSTRCRPEWWVRFIWSVFGR